MKKLTLAILFLTSCSVFAQDVYVNKVTTSGSVECTEIVKLSEQIISIGDTTGFVLSGDSITVTTESNVIIDTEAGATNDTLAVMTGFINQIVHISTRNADRDVAIMDSGKFQLGANRILNHPGDVIVLKATSATEWKEVSWSSNDN